MTSAGGSYGISGGGSGYGVIFAVDTDGNNYQILHHFAGSPNDGNNPKGSLTLVGSRLYGMTAGGGAAAGPGVIFSIELGGSDYKVIFDFSNSPEGAGGPLGSLTPWRSKLYGMTSQGGVGGKGSIFKINLDGTGFTILHSFMPTPCDGGDPFGDLAFSESMAYGWTYAGGSAGDGVLFACPVPNWEPGTMELLLLN